ncbi:MAG: FtsX-like permease family protein [Flavobacteriaceae bacterium]|nr:MAG: FtsX-like permease family protein [Flavobacteriaceae bacterium]
MNYELFIAKRIIAGKEYKNSISAPIIKIAIIAIALGITVMLIATATTTGLQHKIRNKISGFKGHIQITNFDNNNSGISLVPISKNQYFFPTIPNVDGIKKVQVFATRAGLIKTATDFEGIIFKGVSKSYDWTFFKEYLIAGDLPDYNQRRVKDVLLSKTFVDNLQLKLNDTITATFFKDKKNSLPSVRKYHIKGIYDTGFLEFDKTVMIGDIKEVQRLNKWRVNEEVGGFEVILEDFNQIEEKSKTIYKEIPVTLNAISIVEAYPAIFEWIALFDNNVWFIIVMMILVAGINMITALLVLILERVQMVGILKSLGSSDTSIRKIFLYNASYLILKGLFFGNLIGLTVLFIQKYTGFITLNPETYYVSSVPVYMSFWNILFLNSGTLILCFLMLLIPSYVITKIQPSKSIRFA